MRFHLLDSVDEVTEDRIVAVKVVSLAEEYLADHFPTFPVLPGVLMLEAATQAAAWLCFRRSGWEETVAVLKAARNIRYGHFVSPGRALRVEVAWQKDLPPAAGTPAGTALRQFKVEGTVQTDAGPRTAFSGRLDLAAFRLADRQPELAGLDERLADHHRARWDELTVGRTAIGL